MKIVGLLMALLLFPACSWGWESYSGRNLVAYVHSVEEGNVILVNESRWNKKDVLPIRFYGIGIPTEKQPFGAEAHAELQKLLPEGQKLLLTTVNEQPDGIISALVQVSDRSVNNQLLEMGLAWVDRHTCKAFFCRRWHIQENLAIKAKKGLWSLGLPTPPWQWGE